MRLIFPSEDNYAEYEQAEISECAADIYQDLKNFAENCRSGSEEAMSAALTQCHNNFKDYWGMRLISLQAALHRAAYLNTNDDDDEDNDEPKKLSKQELKNEQRRKLNEARRRMAEKYGDEYDDSQDD